MSANDRQVGGDHYQGEMQHWDLVVATGMGYFEGQITKYVSRWRKKNGIQDLRKAQHFLQKLVENVGVYAPGRISLKHGANIIHVRRFQECQNLPLADISIVGNVVTWQDSYDLAIVRDQLDKLIIAAAEDEQPGSPGDGGHHARFMED